MDFCGVMTSSLLLLLKNIMKNWFFSNNMKTVVDRHMVTIKSEYKHKVSGHFEPICRTVTVTVDEILIFS